MDRGTEIEEDVGGGQMERESGGWGGERKRSEKEE